MPFGGHRGCTPGSTPCGEQVNAQIRAGGVFDEVVDFDQALRDPYRTARLRPPYDSGTICTRRRGTGDGAVTDLRSHAAAL